MKTKEIWDCINEAEKALAPILTFIEEGSIHPKNGGLSYTYAMAQSSATKLKKDIADLYCHTLSYAQERRFEDDKR
jgi:hypothetical protein